MTLTTQGQDTARFFAEPPPASGRVDDTVAWCARQFSKLETFLQQPEFSSVTHAPLDVVVDPATKLGPGLVLYAAAGVLGPAEGLYLREGAAWKRVQTA